MAASPSRRLHCASRAELERRWGAVREWMVTHRVDALVAQGRRDFQGGYVKWFSDVPAFNPRSVVFFADWPMTIVEHGARGGRRRVDPDHPDTLGVDWLCTTDAVATARYTQSRDAEAVTSSLRAAGVRRAVPIAPEAMPWSFVTGLSAALGVVLDLDFAAAATDAIDAIKAVKSTEEIAQVERLCRLHDSIFERLLEEVRPGMRDFEVTALARHLGERQGAEQALFLASSAPAGEPALLRPRQQQGRLIREGDVLNLLIENNGPGGYYGEFVRTIVFGRAPDALRRAFDVVVEAQQRTAESLTAGAAVAAIAAAHDAFMVAAGYHAEDRLFAHGQGFDLVERPLIRDDESMPLAAGMVVSCHPAVKTAEVYASIGDNFLVRPEGPAQRMHATPQRLFERV